MSNFKIIKKGYSQIEVDSFIEKLKNDYESKLSEQKDRIFYLKDQIEKMTNSSDGELVSSLVSAVERAKVIETSSKNIYELETKKLNLLYSKMENLLNDENINNDRSIKKELLLLIQDCRNSFQNSILQQNQNIHEITTVDDPVKKLLSKMIDFNKISDKKINNNQTSRNTFFQPTNINNLQKNGNLVEKKDNIIDNKKIENKNLENKNSMISNQMDLTKTKLEREKDFKIEKTDFKNETSKQIKINQLKNLDCFDDRKVQNNNYEPNESGFDLKQALNPKEDLEDIMKAFDFYNDNKKR